MKNNIVELLKKVDAGQCQSKSNCATCFYYFRCAKADKGNCKNWSPA